VGPISLEDYYYSRALRRSEEEPWMRGLFACLKWVSSQEPHFSPTFIYSEFFLQFYRRRLKGGKGHGKMFVGMFDLIL